MLNGTQGAGGIPMTLIRLVDIPPEERELVPFQQREDEEPEQSATRITRPKEDAEYVGPAERLRV